MEVVSVSCDVCVHKDVCIYKEDYRKAVNDLVFANIKLPDNVGTVECRCKFYSHDF